MAVYQRVLFRWASLSLATQTKEMEAMLREVYGESFVDSPQAALTLKRVKGELLKPSILVDTAVFSTTELAAFIFAEHCKDERMGSDLSSRGFGQEIGRRNTGKSVTIPSNRKSSRDLAYGRAST